MAEYVLSAATPARRRAPALLPHLDWVLVGIIAAVALLGLVMVGSASISSAERDIGQAFYYLQRQAAYMGLGLLAAAVVLRIPLRHWEGAGATLLVFACFLLALVLVPGVGKAVNGSVRWLDLGPFNLQVSEVAKLFMLVYLAGYLVRRGEAVRGSNTGFLIPVGLVSLAALLMLLEPDFGAAAVLMATALAMLFIAGVPLRRFLVLMIMAAAVGAALIVTEPYRWERLISFMNPWADPFDAGFQLTQSLIAIGRGGLFGVGLGASVQKLFYLPEAHTDFLFAVLAEELGLVGVITVIGLYVALLWRVFTIGRGALVAGRPFGAFLAYGTGCWLGIQAFVNLGVNMGLLPTKGLTLPLMSYGGSSLLVTAVALALVLRVDHEVRVAGLAAAPREGRR